MKHIIHKRPSESTIIKTEVVCPNDTNSLGLLKGGRLIEWMDMAAAGCALIHSSQACVTAGIHYVDFVEAAHTGDIVCIKAKLTRVFTTSMEIFVHAYACNVKRRKKYLISEAYFTFVALNDDGKPTKAIAIKPITESEKKNFDEALLRKKSVSSIKKQMKQEQSVTKKI